MPYVRRSTGEQLTVEAVQALAAAFGLQLPAADLPLIASALTDQLAAIAALERLPLAQAAPALQFDPRWPD